MIFYGKRNAWVQLVIYTCAKLNKQITRHIVSKSAPTYRNIEPIDTDIVLRKKKRIDIHFFF